MATKKTDLVTIDQALGSREVLAYLQDPDSIDVRAFQADPDQVRADIEGRLYGATSLDELLGESDTLSGKNYVNKPFQVRSVRWQTSDLQGEGLPFFAVIDAATYDGELVVITCGARSVVQKLAIMQTNGWLPAWVKITEGKQTEAGYKPLDLASAPEPFAS